MARVQSSAQRRSTRLNAGPLDSVSAVAVPVLTREARLDLRAKARGPVLLLTDQFTPHSVSAHALSLQALLCTSTCTFIHTRSPTQVISMPKNKGLAKGQAANIVAVKTTPKPARRPAAKKAVAQIAKGRKAAAKKREQDEDTSEAVEADPAEELEEEDDDAEVPPPPLPPCLSAHQ